MRGQSVLVWGGTGFIGNHLVSGLLTAGFRVGVVGRAESPPDYVRWAANVDWFRWSGGGEDLNLLRRALERASIIFNLAGSSGAVESNRCAGHSLETICGTQLRFLTACAECGKTPHVVFTSSRLVYGHGLPEPISEETPTAPRSMYAAHKICAEQYHAIIALHGKLTYSICRISNAFGPDNNWNRKSHGFINSLIYRGARGLPAALFGDGRQLRDYIYIDDLVDALLLCGVRPEARNQVFNIGRGESISILAAAREVQRVYGNAIEFFPWPAEYRIVESGDCVFDISKAHELLGFKPRTTFSAGVGMTADAIQTETGALGNWRVTSAAASANGLPISTPYCFPEQI